MITATPAANGSLELTDDSQLLKPHELTLIQAALKAGLTEFTIPVEGQFRQIWLTRKWMTMRDGKPACFLVAFRSENHHFEILGPDAPLETKAARAS